MTRTPLVASLAFLLACSSTPAKEPTPPPASSDPAPATSSPEPVKPAATTPEAAGPALEQLTISLEPRYLSWRTASKEVVYEEDSGVMKPAYRHFYFDQSEFEEKVGTKGTIEGKPSMTIEVVEKSEGTADTSGGAAPEGGIAITTYHCRIVSVNP